MLIPLVKAIVSTQNRNSVILAATITRLTKHTIKAHMHSNAYAYANRKNAMKCSLNAYKLIVRLFFWRRIVFSPNLNFAFLIKIVLC